MTIRGNISKLTLGTTFAPPYHCRRWVISGRIEHLFDTYQPHSTRRIFAESGRGARFR